MKSPSSLNRLLHHLTSCCAAVTLLLCAFPIGCKQLEKLRPGATVDVGLLGAPSGPQDTQPAAGSTTQSSPPARGVVWQDGDNLMIGNEAGKGIKALGEIFGFDEAKRTAGNVGGAVMTLKDTPVPVVMYSFSSSSFRGGACARYSNIILNFSSLKKPIESLLLGWEQTTEGAALSFIELSVGSAKELFVSPAYVVFPDQTRVVQTDGPLVQLAYSTGKPGEPGSVPAGSVLVVSRNGPEVTRTSFPDTGEYTIGLKRVRNSNDVIAWRVEDKAGKCSHRATLGFPVRGAVPNIVKYSIPVAKLPVPAGK